MSFCGGCGAPRVAGDQFCPQCGRAYTAEEPPAPAAEPRVSPPPAAPRAEPADQPFPEWAPYAAGAAVFFMPFISLIVSLVMRSSEQRPSRRSFLKNWAIASGVWLCTGWLIVIIAFASIVGSSAFGGGCRGGIDTLTPPSYQSDSTGKHWTAIVPCLGGGSKTRPATKSETKWLNGH